MREEAALAYNLWALKRYGPETFLNDVGNAGRQDPKELLHRGLGLLRQRQSAALSAA